MSAKSKAKPTEDYNRLPIGLPYCVNHKDTHTDCPIARLARQSDGEFTVLRTAEVEKRLGEREEG